MSARSDSSPLLHSSQSAAFVDEDSGPPIGEKSSTPGVFHGWRVGVTICAITAGVVFTINLAVLYGQPPSLEYKKESERYKMAAAQKFGH